jgi:8-oxo-dGTP diphosphatase
VGGETIRETARREVREECGIEVQVGEVLDVIDAIHRDQERKVRYHYVLIDLVATHLSGELKPGSDIDEARWVMREELDKFHLYERLKSVILKALEKGA